MIDPLAELGERRRRKPFEPFRIKLKDGRAFDVMRPLQFACNQWRVVMLGENDRIDPFRPEDIAEFQPLHPMGDKREQTLRQALLAKPFAPFTLVMNDGERLDVRRRFACAFAGDLVYVRLPGRSVTTRLQKVAAIELPSGAVNAF